ncbi:MAG: ATP-binding protein [Pseudomonadota bacterium]
MTNFDPQSASGAEGLSPARFAASEEMVLFPADFPGIDELIEFFWRAAESGLSCWGYDSKKMNIHLSLHEAVVNAWKHGNQQRPDLAITLRWRFASAVTFEILDAGQGFSRQTQSEPFTPGRIAAESGRGLFIIRFCADRVRWQKNGSHIILTFAHP